MKRKVQQLGSSTLAVTVPAEWARQHDIEKGDEVIVQRDENSGSLLLVPEQPSIADTNASIDMDRLDGPAALERAVVSQYVLGRQLIRIESSTPLGVEHHNAVISAERRLMGLGIVEENESHITVRCSVAPGDFDLSTLLGRISRTEATMRADAVRVDLRVVDSSEFGAALQYFTGSKAHNVTVRNRALARDLKVNEYGVFDTEAVDDPDAGQRVGTRVAGQTEPDMYGAVGLSWIPPELREDNGEIQAAAEGALPDLIEEGAIAGDLHTHTNWSDGGFTIEQMVRAAIDRGYEYHAVTDHAEGPGIFGDTGLSEADLTEQAAAIQDAVDGLAIEVFHGVEANIAADGEVTTADEALADLDLVVASPHSALDQGRQDATDRLVRAIEHPEVDILGHPTGRLINSRSGLEVDIHELAAAAAKHDVAIEVNSNPARLDADGTMVRAAVEAGAPIVIDTDAHGPRQFDHVRYGIHTARRGWAESADVINTRSPEQLRSFLES